MRILLLVLVGVMAMGCKSGVKQGSEKGSCYGNGTCDDGLVCLSEVCVDPLTFGKKPSDDSNKQSDYIKKSKTSEANQFLHKMSDAARVYYSSPGIVGSMDTLALPIMAKQFPDSVGPTPPLGTCCKDGGKCAPTANAWEAPAWVALDFAMHDPHYFSYEFESSKDEDTQSYTATAYGDLDCDGEYSTFTLYGEVIEGEVETSGDIIKVQALE